MYLMCSNCAIMQSNIWQLATLFISINNANLPIFVIYGAETCNRL